MSKTAPVPLAKLDAPEAWQPWQPDTQRPWNLKWAGHLYRRAGFGTNLETLHKAVQDGLPSTLERLLTGGPQADRLEGFFQSLGEKMAGQDEPQQLRAWWLYCLFYSPYPLREKMVLFWHNHFATSIAKVQRTTLMYQQNLLLRKHALGKFRALLLEMSRDPAMLVWLDSNNNVKGKPNENYARELMELFSLGVGHYTEPDIREAARAFTGWHTDGDKFDFNAGFHDDGPKTVLGQKGNWNGEDIVRIVLEQPAAGQFLVRKLYRFLISETANPPAALLEPLAESFRKSDYDIGGLLRRMLSSRHFFSDYAYRQRIKSPVEFVLGTVQALSMGEISPAMLVAHLESMGQSLFTPPNVKGWEGGRSWLNTATVLARHNFAQLAASGSLYDRATAGARRSEVKPTKLEQPPTEPDKLLGPLLDELLQGDINGANKSKLKAFLVDGKPKGPALQQRLAEATHAIMTMPEYQLA